MLLWLAHNFTHLFRFLNVFQYLTLRTILSALTGLFITLGAGPAVIRYLTRKQIGQNVRTNGPQSHFSKSGTPTMGGILVVMAVILSTLLWADLRNPYILLTLAVTLFFGFIGFIDDYKKLILKNSQGLRAASKYFCQSVIGLAAALALYSLAKKPVETQLLIPFFKNIYINLGVFYIFLTYFVIVGSSNAVNLTDGLDGLAILPVVLVAGALGIFAYLSGHLFFANYLNIPSIPGTGELVIFCGSLVGAGLGFLWFNAYPAQIFMGDVGALALGAALGIIAVMVRQECVFFVMSGVFVAETLSVMLQVGFFKLTHGRRIFRMAPLHHHFELKGWPEPRVVVRFWVITVILVLCGLATLKLR